MFRLYLKSLNNTLNGISFCYLRQISSSPILGEARENYEVINDEHKWSSETSEEFRTLELIRKKFQSRKPKKRQTPPNPPRYLTQKLDQDWGNVWPAARTFHPATVPLPVRQGYPATNKPTPDKWGNAELMKIPNFLHLSPPVIERHCLAIKKLCTPWPKELDSEESISRHYPLTVITNSYVHSSPSIRNDKARIVTIKVSLKNLDLDHHARDKLLRLVGGRFDLETDILTLTADRCPLSMQNQEYLNYLLTVLYMESCKTESWEHEKEAQDYEMFVWEGSSSHNSLTHLQSISDISDGAATDFKNAVNLIHNDGEDERSTLNYQRAVRAVLNLS